LTTAGIVSIMAEMIRTRSNQVGHELAIALRRAYLGMHRRTDAALAGSGVTADQFVVLNALSDGRAVTQQGLAVALSTDPNTLRAMLVILDRKNLIRRAPHPTDGRARLVTLTEEGERVHSCLWSATDALRHSLVSALGEADTELFLSLLQRFEKAMSPKEATV